MAFSVQMPALGESVTEGTVTRWLKQEGDQVAVDEPLLEVSTDKVDTEIPSPAAGVLSRIVVGEDETVDVGAELAVIDSAGGGSSSDSGSDSDAGSDTGSGSDSGQADSGSSEARAETHDEHPEPAAQADEQAEAPSTEQDQPTAKPTADAQPRSGSGSASGSGTPVTMPALGESVTEGTVTRWLKQVGDQVAVDEPLLEVSTDKVDTEIPSPVAGTVLQIDVGEDETVEVGAQLAMIGSGDAGESAPSDSDDDQDTQQSDEAPHALRDEAKQQQQDDAGDEPAAKPEQREQEPAPASQSTPQEQAAAAHAEPTSSNGAQPSTPSVSSAAPSSTPAPSSGGAPYVTPLVRKLAAEHDVDLAGLKGTGVGGRIRKQDVLEAAESAKAAAAAEAAEAERRKSQPAPQQPAAPASTGGAPTGGAPTPAARTQSSAPVGNAAALRGTTVKMTRLRKTIARRMVESLQVSAQLTTVLEVDVTRISRLRDRAKRDFEAREGVKLSYLPFLAKAAVEALKSHPMVNASIDSETSEVTYHGAEHLGVAVDTERGLLVPVIHDAGDLNIAGIARRIADLAERTRANKVSPDELGGGTFTLTNTGSRGALFDTPIINQPQVAILGTGAVVKRPVVVSDDTGDTIAIRAMMYLALSYDHRIVDGADAARFLSTMKTRLEEGNFEADL